ncbi:holo-ACP synthase [Dasania sp. GY-MA-18]|uniref:Holo-[acyl-carrier-protein] synthase n=1 Tax=Dasania phycosphaerae TaxID=2950436 RepID=A0A9J6RN19_9GAMM|nr:MULTISPECIES: holo-ACP synthase [Dasania]MCR8923314.1 holo-ACP synthase [Dasania sp. GY-MA-18]MCZ0865746.1 holo-ACP synthase [Dasania phycosphaerae]MCZ0869471.1 holo-ACP synthase [Dasania phycosphaerae]
MIVGIGTDLVKIARIEASYQRLGDKFAQRILTAQEFKQFQTAAKPMALLAKRFAVKEATGKALGTGIGQGVSWQDIYIEHSPQGAPILCLAGKAAEYAASKQVCAQHVSISDEDDIATAFVILES